MTIPNRPFGVELEFFSAPHPQVVAWMIESLGYRSADSEDPMKRYPDFTYWYVGDDASIRGPGVRIEISSPILKGAKGLAEVRKVCRVLQELGCKTNASCGLHVHVARGRLSPKVGYTMIKRYGTHEDEIDSWITKARRGSRCSSCTSHKRDVKNLTDIYNDPYERSQMFGDHEDILDSVDGEKIRISENYPTWEFRHHHGTLDPTEVSNWIQFCLNFVETSADLSPGTRRKTKRTRDTGPLLGLPSSVRNHFRYQAERFK